MATGACWGWAPLEKNVLGVGEGSRITDELQLGVPLALGTRFGAYDIVAPLGAGGMGEVFAAFDETLKRRVAIKAIHAQRLITDDAKARFLGRRRSCRASITPTSAEFTIT